LEVLRQPLEDATGDHQPGSNVADFSCFVHAGSSDESVSLRLLERSHTRMPLHAFADSALRRPHLGPAAGSHRHPYRRTGGALFAISPVTAAGMPEDSAAIRRRVINARERQGKRLASDGIFSNAAMNAASDPPLLPD